LRTRYGGTTVLIAVGVLAFGGGVFLPRIHAFGGPSATEIVQTIHEKEGIHRGTQEGVTPSLSPSSAPAMSDISAPPSIPPPSSTRSSSPFPTRREALDRQKVVVEIGTTGEQYRIDAPVADTTYDLRSFTSTAYPSGSSFPLAFGPESPGARTVVIGGTVIGQQQRSLSWEDVHDPFGGGGLRMIGIDSLVSYDLRVNNVNDGFMPLPPPDDLNGARFLIDGCHMTWIRDDAVEDDTEMSGTIRDCLFDGINTGVSIGQSTQNPDAVVRIKHSVFLFEPMRNDRATDGIGHQTLFKQKPGGHVRLSKVVVCYPENPMSPSRLRIFPPGHYSNVRLVLGSDFVGRYPGPRPAGVTVTRDWSVCERARADWLRRH
jgi:hypothetical protein